MLAIFEAGCASDHGGEFVNQLVRITYDGRTGSKKDHDDIVDALAHAVAHCKTSLISDIADNMATHKAAQIDRWARIPLRHGGLGGGDLEEYPQTSRWASPRGLGATSLGEALLEEDEVLVALQERRDRFQETINQDLRDGRRPDQWMVEKVKSLSEQIKSLKEVNVL